MKKILSFVDAAKQKVTLTIECENREKHPVRHWETLEVVENAGTFSITGDCAGHSGQCQDAIVPTPTQQKLIDFWNTYRLNTLRAGTRRQMEALDKVRSKIDEKVRKGADRWALDTRYLRFIGLLEDNGYKFGTDWLYRPYPEDELQQIIKDIETEEVIRRTSLSSDTDLAVDDPADEDAIINFIEEKCEVDRDEAYRRLALAQHCNLEVTEIPDIKPSEHQDNQYTVQGTEYYAGTEDELSDLAKKQLTEDKYLWIEAIKADRTEESLEDWADTVIDTDGWASVLNGYDGTYNEYDFTEPYVESVCICRC